MFIRPKKNPTREAVMRRAKSMGKYLGKQEIFGEEGSIDYPAIARMIEIEIEWENLS